MAAPTGPNYGSQAAVTGSSLALSIFADISKTWLTVEYPDLLWKKIVTAEQINSSINAGAQVYTRMIKDRQGAAAFQSQGSGNNIPRVNLSIGALNVPMCVSAIGAEVTNEDARQFQFGQLGNLPGDLQEAMQMGCENLVETTFFYGDASVGFIGWLSYTGIAVTNVPNTGSSSGTTWASKTGLQIWSDINASLTLMWTGSNTLFIPNLLCLPPAQFSILQQPMVIGGVSVGMSIMEYVKQNNICKALGKSLDIEAIRYLSGAGNAGKDRMVVQCRDRKYQEMPYPLAYTLQQPIPVALGSQMFAEQKHGSYAVYQQGTMLYVDGI